MILLLATLLSWWPLSGFGQTAEFTVKSDSSVVVIIGDRLTGSFGCSFQAAETWVTVFPNRTPEPCEVTSREAATKGTFTITVKFGQSMYGMKKIYIRDESNFDWYSGGVWWVTEELAEIKQLPSPQQDPAEIRYSITQQRLVLVDGIWRGELGFVFRNGVLQTAGEDYLTKDGGISPAGELWPADDIVSVLVIGAAK